MEAREHRNNWEAAEAIAQSMQDELNAHKPVSMDLAVGNVTPDEGTVPGDVLVTNPIWFGQEYYAYTVTDRESKTVAVKPFTSNDSRPVVPAQPQLVCDLPAPHADYCNIVDYVAISKGVPVAELNSPGWQIGVLQQSR
jgi:hypothetical protein